MTQIAIFPNRGRRGFGLGDARQTRWLDAGGALARGTKRFVAMAGTVFQALTEARAAEFAYRELSRLSDRELADMGLTRTDIPAVVARNFTRGDEAPLAATSVGAGEAEIRKAA